MQQTATLNFGRSYLTNEPVMSEIVDKAPATIALVGVSTILSAVFGVLIGIVAGWRRRSKTDYAATTFTMTLYSMPDFWLGMLLLSLFAVSLGWFPIGGLEDPTSDATGLALLGRPGVAHVPAGAHADARLPRRVHARDALVAARHDARGLPRARARQGAARRRRCATATRCRTRCCRSSTLAAINFGFVLSGAITVETIFSWPGLGLATYEAIQGPDLPMLQGLFLVFSASVIVFNLLADLLYVALDPRVRTA